MAKRHETFTTGKNCWKNIRRRYWRNEAKQPAALELWGEENVSRMKRGMAPQKVALVTNTDGTEARKVKLSLELHHVFGIREVPTDDETVIALWPHHHAQLEGRDAGYVFSHWVEE